jgi:hypothetical protein
MYHYNIRNNEMFDTIKSLLKRKASPWDQFVEQHPNKELLTSEDRKYGRYQHVMRTMFNLKQNGKSLETLILYVSDHVNSDPDFVMPPRMKQQFLDHFEAVYAGNTAPNKPTVLGVMSYDPSWHMSRMNIIDKRGSDASSGR